MKKRGAVSLSRILYFGLFFLIGVYLLVFLSILSPFSSSEGFWGGGSSWSRSGPLHCSYPCFKDLASYSREKEEERKVQREAYLLQSQLLPIPPIDLELVMLHPGKQTAQVWLEINAKRDKELKEARQGDHERMDRLNSLWARLKRENKDHEAKKQWKRDSDGKAVAPVVWSAPFFSGGGYCTEATDFVEAMEKKMSSLKIAHYGDDYRRSYVDSNFPKTLKSLIHEQNDTRTLEKSIIVCHAMAPFCGVAFHSAILRNKTVPYKIIRTVSHKFSGNFLSVIKTLSFFFGKMFETDRLGEDWVEECNRADEVWVPSIFNLATFVLSGVEKGKVRVIGEAVDTDLFSPLKVKPLNLLKHLRSDDGSPYSVGSKKPFVFLRCRNFTKKKLCK